MRNLICLLLLSQLAVARPGVDLSALDRPGLSTPERQKLLDRAYRQFPDATVRFEADCLRAEALLKASDPAVCEAIRSLRQRVVDIPPGQARARFLWLCAKSSPLEQRAGLVREALDQPGLHPELEMRWLRSVWYWVGAQKERAQRQWLMDRGRKLAEQSHLSTVQLGWLDILAKDAESKGLLDQQHSFLRSVARMAETNRWPEEQLPALVELKAPWNEIEAAIFSLPRGPRRDELILSRIFLCPDLSSAERWLKAMVQPESLKARAAYLDWYWGGAVDRLGLDPEKGLRFGRSLISNLQAAGEVENEIKWRDRIANELETRGQYPEARRQRRAAYQLRLDHPWPDPDLLPHSASSLGVGEAFLLERQGLHNQALALWQQLAAAPDLKLDDQKTLLHNCLRLEANLGDQEGLRRHWRELFQLAPKLRQEKRLDAYESLLRFLPPELEDQRPALMRLLREESLQAMDSAEAGTPRLLAAQQVEGVLQLQKDNPAQLQLWNRELERARGRDDQIMIDWAALKLLENYSNSGKVEEFKALAEPLLASPLISSLLRTDILRGSVLLARTQDPLALIWSDKLVQLARKGGDRQRLSTALGHRAEVKQLLGRPESALEDAQEAFGLESARSRSYTLVHLCSILKEVGRQDQALVLLRQDVADHLASDSPQLATVSLGKLIELQPKGSAVWKLDCERALTRLESLGESARGARDQVLFAWLQQLAREEAWQEGRQLLQQHPWLQTPAQNMTSQLRSHKSWEDLFPAPPPAPNPTTSQAAPDSLAVKLDELRLARPELAQWLSLRSSNLKQLQAHLGPHDTLVTYANLGDELYVLIVRAQQTFWVNRRLDVDRATRDYLAALRSDRPSQAEADLHSLLLEPVLRADPEQRLLLVPTGKLWQVPFGALRDRRGDSAASQAEMVLLTSGDLLKLADNSWQPYRLSMPLAIGAPPAADLPGAYAELEDVSRVLPGCRLRRGEQATLACLREGEQPWGLIHFATHAHYNRDRPTESNIELHGGSLRAREVSRIPLAEHAMVALSCCQGGSADRQNLEDPVTLATSFASAGADTVVGNLWQVDDQVARLFFVSFYKELSTGATPARSFRAAQLASRAAYPKTRDWGGFFLLGNPN